MRHHHSGAARHDPLQRSLHHSLALAVEGAGGLVQQEHAGVADDGARDGHALLLAAAQLHAALANISVVPVGGTASGPRMGGWWWWWWWWSNEERTFTKHSDS
jgi:hypothetical protein